MKVEVFSLKPFHDVDGRFVNIPNQPTFDPSHPITYPGNEVRLVETMGKKEAQEKYGRYIEDVPYIVRNSGSKNMTIVILEYTGRTSADVIEDMKCLQS